MKIAIWHNLPSGGGKRALYNHVNYLKKRGHFLESWTTDCSDITYLPLSGIINEVRMPLRNKIDKAKKIKNPIKRVHQVTALLKENALACAGEIDSKEFDVVFVNACMFTSMTFIGLYLNTPKAIYLGEPFRKLFETTENSNVWVLPKKKKGLKSIYRLFKDYRINYARRSQLTEEINAAKPYNRILVNSLYSRESVKRAYGIDSEVCYLGIDEKEFTHLDVPKKNYVVGLGTIAQHKNIHSVLEVVSKIQVEIRPELHWISNGYDTEYFERVKSMAIEKNVEFIPLIDVPNQKLHQELREALVMIYMPYLEPFGLAPLEANACGTFVLAIAEGGVRESIRHGQNGFLANNLEEITGLLDSIVQNPELALRYGNSAREYVSKEWGFESMGQRIEAALKKVADGE